MEDERRRRLQARLSDRQRALEQLPTSVGLVARVFGGQVQLDAKRALIRCEMRSIQRELTEEVLPSQLEGDALVGHLTGLVTELEGLRSDPAVDPVDQLWEPARSLFDAIARLEDSDLDLRAWGLRRRTWVVDGAGFDALRSDLVQLARAGLQAIERAGRAAEAPERTKEGGVAELRHKLIELRMHPPMRTTTVPMRRGRYGSRPAPVVLTDTQAALRLQQPAHQLEALAVEHGVASLETRARRARIQAASVGPATWMGLIGEMERILALIEADEAPPPRLDQAVEALARVRTCLGQIENGYTSVAMAAVRDLSLAAEVLAEEGAPQVQGIETLDELRLWACRERPPNPQQHAAKGRKLLEALEEALLEVGAGD